jgi:hypothetical protein
LQGDSHGVRHRHQIHPAANERGGAALPAPRDRAGEDGLPPQRPQYVRRGGQRHEFALPPGRTDRERGPRWRTAGHRQFQGRCALRTGIVDPRTECGGHPTPLRNPTCPPATWVSMWRE